MTKQEIVELTKQYAFKGYDVSEIPKPLIEEKVFTCPECGRKKAVDDLLFCQFDTFEDLLNDNVMCKACFEGYF